MMDIFQSLFQRQKNAAIKTSQEANKLKKIINLQVTLRISEMHFGEEIFSPKIGYQWYMYF